jgi:myo-inositol-hexaphosphate 3-phosphohydrolase
MLFSLNRLNALAVAALILALIAGVTYTPTLTTVAASEKNKSSDKSDKDKSKKSKEKDDDKDDDDDDDQKVSEEQAKAEKERKKAEEKARKEASKSNDKTAEVKEAKAVKAPKPEKAETEKVAEAKEKTAASAKKPEKPAKKGKNDEAKTNTVQSFNDDLEKVFATVETEPVPNGGDAADDPAIWVHPTDSALSLIIGTDKAGGLAVYDLSGKQLQYLADGEMDNVDLRGGFKLGGQEVTLVTASNRRNNSIAIYKIDTATRKLENVAARVITHGMAVYGMCMYRSAKTGKVYYYGNSKTGLVEQYELFEANGKVDAKKVRSFKVGSVVEGCVADDELGKFYISEEPVGIWKYDAEPEGGTTRTQVAKVGDGHLHADVEGLAIAYGPNGTGHLIVSSQGNYSYIAYKREGNNEFVKKFRIGDGDIDGAEETDGLDVTSAPLGDKFPKGLLVVQDGFNDKGAKNQNFKLVPLEAIFK